MMHSLGSKQISQNWINILLGLRLVLGLPRPLPNGINPDSEGRHGSQILSTVSAIAWSSEEELATACYGKVTFLLYKRQFNQSLEWKGSLISMFEP